MGKRRRGILLQGRALCVVFCGIGILPVIHSAGPSSNFNPCTSSSLPSGTGFKGIDSTNRVTYVECLDYSILQSYECSDGSYFDEQSVQCVPGTWKNSSESSPQVENNCVSFYDGFVAISASVYVECSNYVEIGRYSCPDGFYFDGGRQQCTDKNSSATASTLSSTGSITSGDTETASSDLVITPSCENISNGNIPLPSLQGWIVCDKGEVLVTEYCGASKLYNIDYNVCVNYCESTTASSDVPVNQVLLPKLAGQLICNGDLSVSEKIVCSPGTYFDVKLGYCRNFCENETEQYISFPDLQGGVACRNERVVSVEWCDPGSSYNTMIGVCTQTNTPSRSPISTSPTIHTVTASPSAFTPSPSTPPRDITNPPTFELELVVDIPDAGGGGKNSKPGLVVAEDNIAFIVSIRLALLAGTITFMCMIV